MSKKELEEQLEAFFEHNPLDDDMLYLKQFVREHPDNKMGWYLLGKEYALRDKPGKAKYCFAQAGEVFEAFESKKIRLNLMEEWKAGQPVLPGQEGRRKKLVLASRLIAVVLAAMLLGSYITTDGRQTPLPPQEEPAAGPGQETAAEEDAGLRILFTNPLLGKYEEDELWKRLLQSARTSRGRTLLVEGYSTSDGKWINSIRLPGLLMSGTVASSGDRMEVLYHDALYCNCTPVEDREGKEAVEAWMNRQEQEVILRSAILAYRQRYGLPYPETLDGMMRDYPHNLLPGYTEAMQQAYALWLQSGAEEFLTQGLLEPEGSKAGASSVLYREPLEILVDKSNYRLALVSGPVILRSYPIGLGGELTPEGVFRITEKVKNPNNRDDGDFGSRGMQLSDTDYAIHGTNEPGSIEKDLSLGCIRMLRADIEELFDMVPSGTKVTIGEGLLPADIVGKETPFSMPALREEENPGKIYRWLN